MATLERPAGRQRDPPGALERVVQQPVDIGAIEQQKENIQPLATGRSAAQLASLSTHSLSGLGAKLAPQHARFQAQIAAVAQFELTSTWVDGTDGLSADEVAQLAEDPLDIHHQYARFVIEHYPAGNSATSKLVEILDASTRRFVRDVRYRNDPRYLRLWNFYAKNVECPEECYRFLYVRGIGDKLATLYEEYAKVLETMGKRKEADDIYTIGIARGAVPIQRLKQHHLAFQQRMLVAPPLPTTPSLPPTDSATIRPILSGTSLPYTLGPTKENSARAFAVFEDGAEGPQGAPGEHWEDLGTSRSRKRENTVDAGVWKGETLHMSQQPKAPPARLEVFRDQEESQYDARAGSDEVFRRSLRGPSEIEALIKNPFKNYTEEELSINESYLNTSLPPKLAATKPSSKGKEKKTRKMTPAEKREVKEGAERARARAKEDLKTSGEAVACDLGRVYPVEGGEFSFEQLNAEKAGYLRQAQTWNGWEWLEQWEAEVERTGRTSYTVDMETGWPLLYDLVTQAPLWDFLPRPEPSASEEREPEPEPEPDEELPLSPPPAQQQQLAVDSPILSRSPSPSPSPSPQQPAIQVSLLNPRRPPSPTMTMNTREAKNLMNDFFSHTLKLDEYDVQPEGEEEHSDHESGDDEDYVDPSLGPVLPSQPMSQFTQSTIAASQDSDNAPFVPFSQTASQMDVDSFFASQAPSQMEALSTSMAGLVYRDEDSQDVAPAQPLRLFRDASATPASGFRPTRAPLGLKTGDALLVARKFEVHQDVPSANDVFLAPSSQPGEQLDERSSEDDTEDEEGDGDFQDSEQPLRSGEIGDGFAMGRQRGQNRFAPLIHNMTPITERTFEYTAVTSLSTSQRSRRDSMFPPPAPIDEDDEDPSTEDEEEEPYAAGDQAFVAFEGGADSGDGDDSDRSSFRRTGFSSDDDEEDQEVPPPPAVAFVAVSAPSDDSVGDWRDSTRKSAQFEDSVRLSNANDFPTLPEGFTITGNQSGMMSGMVLAETTAGSPLSGSPSASNVVRGAAPSEFPNPCNPFDLDLMARVLELSPQPVLDDPHVHDLTHTPAGKLAGLQKVAKRRENAAKTKGKDRTGVIDEMWELELDGELFSVQEKLGEGAFGAVFLVTAVAAVADASFDDEDADDGRSAVKVEHPTNLWEFYILRELHARLSPRLAQSVVGAQRLFAYQDESYLLLDYCDQGTLLDAVNKANETGIAPPTGGVANGLEEVLAMFFVIELLRILEGFHGAGFVHGDLKIDNCLVRLDQATLSATYDPSGAGGWSSKGLRLVDFGRSIDRTVFVQDQQFLSELETDELDCIEMRESRPWTFEPDYFGAASVAFNLLFGRYIETKTVDQEDGTTRQAINQNFKRYHQAQLWGPLFDVLLNPKSAGTLPITNRLGELRAEMEEWLVANCNRNGKSLKSLIRKLETFSLATKAR